MKTTNWIGLLAVGALGAAGVGNDIAGSTVPADEALFEDSFDDDSNRWGVVNDPQFGTAAFANGDYVWELRGSVAHWLPAVLGEQYDNDELDMLDVVVRTEATIEAGDGVIGVFCRETPDTDADWQWYEFVVRDGYAAIRQADQEANLDILAETDDVSLPVGEPITIEATCVDDANGAAQLSLTLNGTAVLDAIDDDDPLGNGVAGLQAWTFPVHEQMDIRWHEFSVHRPNAEGAAGPTTTE